MSFLGYNKVEEDGRHQKGVQLRNQLRKERKEYKQYKKKMAQIPPKVYNALVNGNNTDGINQLAVQNRVFWENLAEFFRVVSNSQDNNTNPQQHDALGVLQALVTANVPYNNTVGILNDKGALYNINPVQHNLREVLQALVTANVPYNDIVGIPDATDCLGAMGGITVFRETFLDPPQVSFDSSTSSVD